MRDGFIQQVGAPLDIYHHPRNRFVAGFLGTPPMNFLEGKLVRDAGRLWFDGGDGRVAIPTPAAESLSARAGEDIVLGIRPQALSLDRTAAREGNALPAKVLLVEPLGDKMDVTLATSQKARLVAHVDAASGVTPSQERSLYLDLARAHFFEPGAPGSSLARA
jgi:multiple sugar transport system ATP-binding protein